MGYRAAMALDESVAPVVRAAGAQTGVNEAHGG